MKIILILTIIYGIIPLLFFYYKKKNKNDLLAIYPFLVVVFIASIYELIGTVILKISLEKWFLIYKILAFIGILYFFYFLHERRFKTLFFTFIVLFNILLILFNTIWIEYNFIDKSACFNMYQTLIILIFSILWFRKQFLDLTEDNLTKNPNFYFVSGLLICYCGTLFLFLVSSSLYTQDKSNFQYYWLLNILLNFVLRSLLIIGIWKARVK